MSLKVQYVGLRTPVYPTQVSFKAGPGAKRFIKAFVYSFLSVFVLSLMMPGSPTWFWICALGSPIVAVFFLFEEGGQWKGKWWPVVSAVTSAILWVCQFADD